MINKGHPSDVYLGLAKGSIMGWLGAEALELKCLSSLIIIVFTEVISKMLTIATNEKFPPDI